MSGLGSVDVKDWRETTTNDTDVIKWFWKVRMSLWVWVCIMYVWVCGRGV